MFSSMEAEVASLAVYFYIYVYLLMLTWLPKKRLLICSFVRKSVHCFHCLAGNSAIIRSTSPTLSICNAFINSRSSTVNDARVTSFVTSYH